jgi:predicted Zn finger-like uncharacterized protein
MIVNCEECGTRYRLDETKIKGSSAKVKCKSCGHVMLINKPEQESGTDATATVSGGAGAGAADTAGEKVSGGEQSSAAASTGSEGASSGQSTGTAATGAESSRSRAKSKPRKRGRFGLRSKLFLLFVCLPIVIAVVTGYVYLNRVEQIKNSYGNQITDVVTQMGQSQVAAKARSAAQQLRLYLEANPGVQPGEFNRDRTIRRMAVQKIGQTGYTFLYELPGGGNSWNVLVHPDPNMVGTDLSERKGPQGFQRVIQSTSGGKEANGFYTQPKPDGERVEHFMFCAPVGETGYVIAATLEQDSMIQPAHVLNTQLDKTYYTMRNRSLFILGGIAVFFLIIVTWFGHRLTRRIQSLTDVAERISVGELEAEVQVKGKDEISSLAEAISRMQESVRLSIERLRRRRS